MTPSRWQPVQKRFWRSSLGNETHFSAKFAMIREPHYVGCYFLNSLPDFWGLGFGYSLEVGARALEL